MVGTSARSFHFSAGPDRLRIKTMVMVRVALEEAAVPTKDRQVLHICRIGTTLDANGAVMPVAKGRQPSPITGEFRENLFTFSDHHRINSKLREGNARSRRPVRPDRDDRSRAIANRLHSLLWYA